MHLRKQHTEPWGRSVTTAEVYQDPLLSAKNRNMSLQWAQAYWRLEKCHLIIFQSLTAHCLWTCVQCSLIFPVFGWQKWSLDVVAHLSHGSVCFASWNAFLFTMTLKSGYFSYRNTPSCQFKPVCLFSFPLSHQQHISRCSSLAFFSHTILCTL